jgi:hypothetical protein
MLVAVFVAPIMVIGFIVIGLCIKVESLNERQADHQVKVEQLNEQIELLEFHLDGVRARVQLLADADAGVRP